MNQLEFARIHEMQFHGDIRFHLRLHEMTKEPLWPEPVPPHWHEEYEFLVITRGTGTACLNTRTMHIEPGDILFINAGIVHSFRGDEKNPLAFYALDFGRDNVSMLVDHRSIDIVYKPEEKPKLDYFKMERYWVRALKICEEIFDLNEEQVCDVNSDKVPVVLAKKYTNEFDYGVCKKVLFEIEKRAKKRSANSLLFSASLIDVGDIVPQTAGLWYHEKAGEAEKLELRIEELKFEKSQYEEKKREIKKPKGMKSGLIIFIIFSILGVFFPLVCALIDCTYNYSCLCVPIISLGLFVICVLVTFIYLALLLSWKDVDKEVNNHESSGSESEL